MDQPTDEQTDLKNGNGRSGSRGHGSLILIALNQIARFVISSFFPFRKLNFELFLDGSTHLYTTKLSQVSLSCLLLAYATAWRSSDTAFAAALPPPPPLVDPITGLPRSAATVPDALQPRHPHPSMPLPLLGGSRRQPTHHWMALASLTRLPPLTTNSRSAGFGRCRASWSGSMTPSLGCRKIRQYFRRRFGPSGRKTMPSTRLQ